MVSQYLDFLPFEMENEMLVSILLLPKENDCFEVLNPQMDHVHTCPKMHGFHRI